jgi:hypothetical protein
MLAISVCCPLEKELLVNFVGCLKQNFSHYLSNLKVIDAWCAVGSNSQFRFIDILALAGNEQLLFKINLPISMFAQERLDALRGSSTVHTITM